MTNDIWQGKGIMVVRGGEVRLSSVKAVGFSFRKSLSQLLFFLSMQNYCIEVKGEIYLPHAVRMCDLDWSTGVGQCGHCVG